MNQVTRVLSAIEQGDPHAAEQLLPLVYEELRKLAAQKMARDAPGQTLQPTSLVHEAYLRLVGGDRAMHWDNRGHFFAAAAEAMRRILVERARSKHRVKRGRNARRQELQEHFLIAEDRLDQLFAVHEALDELEQHDAQAAALVKLRFFAGFEHQEAPDSVAGVHPLFSPDGKRVAGASRKDNTVKVYDARTGQETLTLKGHTAGVNRVAFSPDGKRLASASADKKVKVWDAQTGQGLLTLQGVARALLTKIPYAETREEAERRKKEFQAWCARPAGVQSAFLDPSRMKAEVANLRQNVTDSA